MDNIKIEEWLNKAGVLPTPIRMLVFKTLEEAECPLSLIDIEQELQTVDRSSISRALTLFKKKHLVHVFEDGSGSVKYDICLHVEHSIEDMHPHFHCNVCGKTYCLTETSVPTITPPEGFQVENINYVIFGQCKNCSS